MRRRDFIVGLILANTVGRAHAEQAGKVYRLAIVSPATPPAEMNETNRNPYLARGYRAFFEEMQRLGYAEGQNLIVERYSGEGQPEHFRALADNVASQNPDVVWAFASPLVLAFKAATTTIPIVGLTSDPVAFGVVPSLARPGGNVTGASIDAGIEVWLKRLDFLREAVPKLSRLALLAARDLSGIQGEALLKEWSLNRGISLIGAPLDSPIDETAYQHAFAAMAQAGADAVYVGQDAENDAYGQAIVDLAEKYRLPAVYGSRAAAASGGLMVYAYDLLDLVRHNADQIDQIFKGTKPGDIPYYQARKFDLIINLKTAKILGLTIPPSLLAQADEVIE
jgi:putative tryptophan/tyrosine transport system substrate-binding protein